MNQNFKVYARIRPIDYQQKIIDIREDTSIQIKEITKIGQESGEVQSYNFAQVFNQMATQEDIFDTMNNQCLGPVLDGQNVCILAYGQTFSGKSFTIFGEDEQYTPGNYFSTDNIDKRGLVPRTLEFFIKKSQEFEDTKTFTIQCSLYEIYLDKIRDLGKAFSEKHSNPALIGKSSQNMPMNFENENLDVGENPNGQIAIKNLMTFSITSMSDLYEMLKAAFKLRSKYETQNNTLSARSHTVFTLNIIQKDKENENLPFINSMIQFVDLAGSERIAKSLAEGVKFQENLIINSNLSALSKCLLQIAQSATKNIPFKESRLTRTLQNCLSSVSKVLLFIHLHPGIDLNLFQQLLFSGCKLLRMCFKFTVQ